MYALLKCAKNFNYLFMASCSTPQQNCKKKNGNKKIEKNFREKFSNQKKLIYSRNNRNNLNEKYIKRFNSTINERKRILDLPFSLIIFQLSFIFVQAGKKFTIILI